MKSLASRRRATYSLVICLSGFFWMACAASIDQIRVPSGVSVSVAEHEVIWNDLSKPCRSVQSADLVVVFRGFSGERSFRRTRARAAVKRPGFLRLEGMAPFGAPAFILIAKPDDATLLLPRERQVVRDASASDLLSALSGLSLEPGDVHALLTGCVVQNGVSLSARTYGDDWIAIDLSGGATVYSRRSGINPVISMGTVGDLVVKYSEHVRGLPRKLRVQTVSPISLTDLTIELTQVNVNTVINPEAFDVSVPPTFSPVAFADFQRQSPTEDQSLTTGGGR